MGYRCEKIEIEDLGNMPNNYILIGGAGMIPKDIANRGNISIEVGGQLDLDGRGSIGTSTFDRGFSST